jgi:hypothetical protein
MFTRMIEFGMVVSTTKPVSIFVVNYLPCETHLGCFWAGGTPAMAR